MTSCAQRDDYLAGRLGNGDTAAFEAHALGCVECGKVVARKRAVERAAKVLKRNEVTRGPTPAPRAAAPASRGPVLTAASSSFFEEPSAAAAESPPQPVRPSVMPTADYDGEMPGGNRRLRLLLAGVVGLVVLVGGVVIFGSRDEAPKAEQPRVEAPVAVAPPPAEPEPQTPPPEVAKTAPDEPALEPAPTPPPPVVATPSPTKPAVDPKLEFYPVGTDYDLLAETIAGKKCGMAVSALRARVAADPREAKSWSLLAQCYVKRKRWKNAIEAYDMVVKYGDAAMASSLAGPIEKARAGVQAEADAAATPAPDAAPAPVAPVE